MKNNGVGNMKIAFFDAKPYDIESFNKINERYNYEITYFESRLKEGFLWAKSVKK